MDLFTNWIVPNFLNPRKWSERDEYWINLKLNLLWKSGNILTQIFISQKLKFIFHLWEFSIYIHFRLLLAQFHKSTNQWKKVKLIWLMVDSIWFKWMKFYLPLVDVLKIQMQTMPLPLMWLLRIAFSRMSPNIFD